MSKLKENDQIRYYYGNVVHRDGRICNALDQEIPIDPSTGRVRIYINGKCRLRLARSIVYEAFSGISARKKVLSYKIEGDYSYDNIIAKDRNDWNKDMRRLTEEQCQKIREEREQPYKYTTPKGRRLSPSKTPYNVLAKRYGCCTATIYRVLAGEYPNQHTKKNK